MHNATVASITTESCTNDSNRKSAMNSISRKYPLVIISHNKDLLNGSSNGESDKSICELQTGSTKCIQKPNLKKAPDIISLTEEADAKWEMIKKSKLKSASSPISAQLLNIPLVDVRYQQQRQNVREGSQLNSPNRAKLRMAPSIDLPQVAIGNQECEITNFPKKAKLKLTSRTSSRSNKGLTQKYSAHQYPRTILNSESVKSPLFSHDKSTNRKFPVSNNNLDSGSISRTEDFECVLQRQASVSDSEIPKKITRSTVSCKYNPKLRFSPKVKSSTIEDDSDYTPGSSLPLSDVGTDSLYTDPTSTDDIESVITTGETLIYDPSLEYPDSDNLSQYSSDEETRSQIETGMVGVYLEASYSQLPPLCSLCCSAGQHELIFCSVCCDCYHRFCVGVDSDYPGEKGWVCSSCISCAVCGRGRDMEVIHQCCKCQSFYHMGCLGIHLPFPPAEGGVNNWPCPRCVVCQSCGTQRPEKFAEQLTTAKLFCKRCIFLRKKGNFCPVCDKVYEENDWNCKMIECDSCKSWLHDSCESFSSEEYYLLGELPGSIPYTCSICQRVSRDTNKVAWRQAIEESRNKRIQSVVDKLNSNQMLKTLLTNLQNAPNGIKNLHSTLSVIIYNVNNARYSTIAEFCKEILSVMREIFKSVDKQNILHRYTFSIQTSFIKLICEEFPWFLIPIDSSVPRPKQERKRRQSTINYFPSSDFFNPSEPSLIFPAYKFDHKYTISGLKRSGKIRESVPTFSSPSKQRPTDRRQCILCKDIGDAAGEKEDRLLPCGINDWVHINCAIWSSDVYTRGSCIKNIDSALLTGLKSCCSCCRLMGATVGCYSRHCTHMVHYKCALAVGWIFLKNMKVFCPEHGSSFDSKFVCSERDFLIDEFLYVESNSASQNQRLHNMTKLTGPRKLNIVSGCVRVYSLGSVVPASDTRDAIYPINFRSSRLFWSARKPGLLSTYTCFVKEYIPEEPINHPDVNYSIQHSTDLISTKKHEQHSNLPTGYQAELAREYPGKDTQPTKLVSLTDYTPTILPANSPNLSFEFESSISNKPDSPLATELSIELSLGSEISSEFLTFKGLFEQSYPFLKQTDSLSVLQKTINYSKINGNKLFPLINEDFYLTQHLTRLNDSDLVYGDKQQQQQQQQQQNMASSQSTSKLKFIIVCSDGFTTQCDTLQGAWDNVISELTLAREASSLLPLSFQTTSPQDMFGFTLNCVQREIEQLDDVDKCSLYQFRFFPPAKREEWNGLDILNENPFGAARCISYTTRSKFGMFNFFYSKHRPPPPQLSVERLSSLLSEDDNNPELQFHTPQFFENGTLPFIRYRQMIKNLPSTVRVFRSEIQGLGLFALRDIDAGDMIIEYTGLVIRPFMCDIKEAYYESKGIGCYMFKIDQNQVVDGTMSGNASRFINHSCQPNCSSKMVIIELKKRILIFTQRRVLKGEELTYDYKFPLEEIKIPCLCNSKKCKKYMN